MFYNFEGTRKKLIIFGTGTVIPMGSVFGGEPVCGERTPGTNK